MVKIGADGRLQSIDNVLGPENLARIRAGLTKDEVLRVLDPPDYSRTIYFKARDELVWDRRYCSDFGMARILVLFDGTAGTIRSTLSLVEYQAGVWCTVIAKLHHGVRCGRIDDRGAAPDSNTLTILFRNAH